jgi:hypothetical protein
MNQLSLPSVLKERFFLVAKQTAISTTPGSARPDVYDPVTGRVNDYKFTINPGRGIPARQQANNTRNLPHVTSQTEINPR